MRKGPRARSDGPADGPQGFDASVVRRDRGCARAARRGFLQVPLSAAPVLQSSFSPRGPRNRWHFAAPSYVDQAKRESRSIFQISRCRCSAQPPPATGTLRRSTRSRSRNVVFGQRASVGKISAKCCSFSAGSAPIFARKYAFCSIFQNLPDCLAEFFEFWQNLKFCKCCKICKICQISKISA